MTMRFLANIAMLVISQPIFAQHKLAILIGINCYDPETPSESDSDCSKLKSVPASDRHGRSKMTVSGDWRYWSYDNLHGAIRDVNLMHSILSANQFETTTLLNEQATADNILAALQRYLIDEAHPGDVSVVYYSGHGNIVFNAENHEPESDNLDQTIVPSDHWRGTPDIRDKELSEILWQAGNKKVRVVLITDSCHSASLTRGVTGRAKTSKDANQKSPLDAGSPHVKDRGHPDHDPADAPVSVIQLAAARRDQPAMESNGPTDNINDREGGTTHGAFTWALKRALEHTPGAPVDEIFAKASLYLSLDKTQQIPNLEGKNRESITVFGERVEDVAQTVKVMAQNDYSSDQPSLTLLGGTAVGIYPGTELKRLSPGGASLVVQVKESFLASSEATVLHQGPGPVIVRKGDFFEVDKWVAPAATMLNIYVPPAAPATAVSQMAAVAATLVADSSIHWIEDETVERATHELHWNGKSWILEEQPPEKTAGTRAVIKPPVDLGPAPSAADIRKRLPEGAKFLLLLPPTAELTAALPFGKETKRIVVTKSAADALYSLDGRAAKEGVEYAWVQPYAQPSSKPSRTVANQNPMPMPARSQWIDLESSPGAAADAAKAIADKAFRIGRLREWQTLESSKNSDFPYHLFIQEVSSKQFMQSGKVFEGKEYKLYLKADPKTLQSLGTKLAPRYIYVFSVDQFGRGTLLCPVLGRGNQGNFFPVPSADPQDPIPLSGDKDHDFGVGPPWGTDTYILLTSATKILNTDIFEFDGVRPKDATRGPVDPLADLLAGVGDLTRGDPITSIPRTWSIEKVYLESVPYIPH